ncbi:MAG: ParB/RepB/Spo0J family partition protein [Acutalibacteraceae bacterium]|nr:ParB/RepB/Spo0J family partition protein [Acutalibacteraceae bacterium]
MSSKLKSSRELLTSVDSLFTTQAERDDELKPKVEEIALDLIDGFENHPFSVKDDEDMKNLVKSISENGVLVPCLARQNGERYELISGHRRKAACELLGITTLPIIIKDMTREEAIITMVDSNIQREHILPSEKAFAYKMKADALSHQGKSLGQLGPKADDNRTTAQIGGELGESYKTVQRYIRLTHLNKQLLDMVDEGRIAFTPAVELSYLNEIEQQDLVDAIGEYDATPNLSQACRFKKMSTEGQGLTPESITEILNEKKANQKPMFKIHYEKLQAVAPKIKEKDFEAFVLEACQRHYKYLQKQKMKDER